MRKAGPAEHTALLLHEHGPSLANAAWTSGKAGWWLGMQVRILRRADARMSYNPGLLCLLQSQA